MRLDALFAFLVAMAVAALLTPLAARFARRVGAVSKVRERGLGKRATPLLGGLAILAGVLVGGGAVDARDGPPARGWSHAHRTPAAIVHTWAMLAGAVPDRARRRDRRRLRPAAAVEALGQIAAALVAVEAGVVVTDVTIPFIGALQFPNAGGVLTVIWLVGLMNVVNFSDGVDGLAAGLCTIDGIAFAIIAFDLNVAARRRSWRH